MSASPLNSVTISAKLVKHLLNKLAHTSEIREQLLRDTDIDLRNFEKKDARISNHSEVLFINNVTKLKGADWVWRHPELWNSNTLGDLSKAFINAPRFSEAVDVLTHYGHLWRPSLYFEQFHESTAKGARRVMTVAMVSEESYEPQSIRIIRNMVMICIYHMFDQILDKTRTELTLSFAGTVNISPEVYKRIFNCPIRTDQNRNSFSIASDAYDRMSPIADTAIYKKAMLGFQTRTDSKSDDKFENKVRDYLAIITTGRPSAADVSRELSVSQRTLNRRLLEAGTTFRRLLDESLEIRSNKLLAEQTLSHADISERLGYTDQASFSRALKRWKQNE